MREKTAKTLRCAAKVLLAGAAAALAMMLVAFVFALISHGADLRAGLDWARKLLYLVGALALVIGGGGLLVSGRGHKEKDEALRVFGQEMGMHWAAAVSLASVDFLVLGTLVDLLYISLPA